MDDTGVRGSKPVGLGLRLADPLVGPQAVSGLWPSEMVKNNHYFTDVEIETQREIGTCSRSHNHEFAEFPRGRASSRIQAWRVGREV